MVSNQVFKLYGTIIIGALLFWILGGKFVEDLDAHDKLFGEPGLT